MLLIILILAQCVTAIRLATDLTIRAPDLKTDPFYVTTEYYAQYLTCAGKAYLLSRVEEPNDLIWGPKGWRTRIRMLEGNKFKVIGTTATPMSHNLAPLCVDGQVLLMGGQWRKTLPGQHWKGIQQALVPNLTVPLDQAQFTLATTGDPSTNCIEGRKTFLGHCEFDGKISLAHKGGTTYMYVRANIAEGTRWVQMIQSDNHKHWSKFEPIEIQGLNRSEPGTNVYYFNVEDWNSTHKAGIFPAVLPNSDIFPGASGIFLTFSEDMVTWCRPSLIKSVARDWGGSRPLEFPVALLNRRLLTMKRNTTFHEAFLISDGPISESPGGTEPSKPLNFIPFGLEIESVADEGLNGE